MPRKSTDAVSKVVKKIPASENGPGQEFIVLQNLDLSILLLSAWKRPDLHYGINLKMDMSNLLPQNLH